MNKHFLYVVAAAFLALGILSCKKEETSSTVPSLQGLLLDDEPVPYVAPGTTITIKADVSSIYTSDDKTPSQPIGIYWIASMNSKTIQRDTTTRNINTSNPPFTFKAEELGKVTITCYAFAGPDYINSTAACTFSVIDPEHSLSGLEGTISSIAGNKYYTTDINGTTWMANNLYGTQDGVSFYLSSVTDSFIGRFYTWEEARRACPAGWSLPTAAEWDALGTDACALMANAVLLEEQMWTYWPGMDITNAKGFNAIPAGYVDFTGGRNNVQGFMNYAIFWTADTSDDEEKGEFRYIYADKPEVQKGFGSKTSLALSVRCIKE